MKANFMKTQRRSAAKSALTSGMLAAVVSLLTVFEASASECHLSVSQPQIDYGLLRPVSKPEARGAFLGKRMVRVSVVCADARVIALRFMGVPADGQGFRFGREGRFDLTLQQPVLDGQAIELAPMHNRAERGGHLRPDQALVLLKAGQPVSGRVFSAQVQIDTYLSNAAASVRDKTLLEGGGRFELVPGG